MATAAALPATAVAAASVLSSCPCIGVPRRYVHPECSSRRRHAGAMRSPWLRSSLAAPLRLAASHRARRRRQPGVAFAEGEEGDGREPEKKDAVSTEDKAAEDLRAQVLAELLKNPPRRGLPKDVIETLRNQIFGFDTFFVTGTEPYEDGTIFKGNLRGDPTKAFEKLTKKAKDVLGDNYKLFLLMDDEVDKPVCVVLPTSDTDFSTAIPQVPAALLFGVLTLLTILFKTGVPADVASDFNLSQIIPLLISAFGTSLPLIAALGAHELGHIIAAKKNNLKLSPPFFIPSLDLGSFGAVTRVRDYVTDRATLMEVAGAGPFAGIAVSLLLLIVGLATSTGLSPSDGVTVNSVIFLDSALVAILGKLILHWDTLLPSQTLQLNPLVLTAWAALLSNALNTLPVGFTDGASISHGIFGRKIARRVGAIGIGLLSLWALGSDVLLYWVIVVVLIQRGPVLPQCNEVSQPPQAYKAAGYAVIAVALLSLLPAVGPLQTALGLLPGIDDLSSGNIIL